MILCLLFLSSNGFAQSKEVTIEDIVFVGNKRTKESFIRRELSFKEGDVRDLAEFKVSIEQDRRNIFNLRLFVEVTADILEKDLNTVIVMITVKERWFWVGAPIFRLADRNFNEWWGDRNRDLKRINYGFMFQHFNVRGKGEKLNVKVQAGFVRNYSFGYSFPYIDKEQRFGLKFGFGYKEQKNLNHITIDHNQDFLESEEKLFRQTRGEVILTHRPGIFVMNELQIQFRRNTVTDTVILANPNYLGFRDGLPLQEQAYFNLGYVFRIDKRDAKNYPLSGYDFNTLIKKRGIGIFKDLDAFYVNTYFGKFTPLGKDYYTSNVVRALIGGPGDQAYRGYTSLGFGRSLVRGYEQVVVEGSDYYLSKNDFKKKVFGRKFNLGNYMPIEQFREVPLDIYVKAFFDAGYVNNFENYPNNDRLSNRLIYSVGLGVDLVTYYDFVLRFEFSQTAENTNHFFVNFKSAL